MSAIILNRMYVGKYLKTADNIGHEIINLYKSDNGYNYVYVNPYGWIAKKWDGKISDILLVRMINQSTLEILGVASELEQIISGYTTDSENDIFKVQKTYVKENAIKYGSVSLDEIMERNQDDVKYKPLLVTFKAGCVKRSAQTLYLTTDKSLEKKSQFHYLPNFNFSNQSLKIYCDEKNCAKAYNKLKKLIDDPSLWQSATESTKKVTLDKDKRSEKFSFLTLIKKEYDELSYSNMLEYFFNLDKKAFTLFCKEVLKIKNFGRDYEIVRESEGNIDLLIKNQTHVIVIENKIRSGINGLGGSTENDDVNNQLKKYSSYVRKNYKGLNHHFFLLTPDYNIIDPIKYTNEEEDKYTPLRYSEIYNFFFNVNSIQLKENKYFKDFLIALKKQSELVDNQNFDVMQTRLKKRIKQILDQASSSS